MNKTFMDIFLDDFSKLKDFDLHEFIKSIGDLNSITSMEFIDKISLLNKKDRDVVLSNDIIKSKLKLGLLNESKDNQWYYYREILNKISVSEFLSLYDDEFLDKYFTSHQGEYLYRFWASMCEKNINVVIDLIIDDDNLFESFLKESNNFESLFVNIDYDLLLKLIYKLQERKSNFDYDFFGSISKEHQYLLLEAANISDETLVYLINTFYNEVKSYFFQNDNRALYLYDKFNILELCDSGVKFNINILKKNGFFELLKNRSLILFRKNINNIEKNNNPIFIEEKVDKYYEELLSLYYDNYDMFTPYRKILDNPGIIVNWDKQVSYLFSFDIIDKLTSLLRQDENGKYYFDNLDELEKFLKDETSKKISEIMIDSLFRDNIYNVWLNIKEMLRYNSNLDDNSKVLDNEKVNFYNYIINFDRLSNIDKFKFYNLVKNKNVSLTFYEDLFKVKNHAYNKIKEKLFSFDTYSELLVDKSLDIYGVNVYDLRDKQFNMLVRSQSQYRSESHYSRNCYSIISNENTSVFGEADANAFLYGYNCFDNDTILHMFEKDSYSSSFRDNSSRFVNRIMTIDELVRTSFSYNEIQIINKKIAGTKHNYNVKKPDFIVVFDYVLNKHIEEAKRLNIPIVIIRKQKLENKRDDNFNDNGNGNVYVTNIYSENEHRVRR